MMKKKENKNEKNTKKIEEQVPVVDSGEDRTAEKKDVRLIPFTVQAIEKKVDNVPSGVELIEAPAMWEKGYKGDNVVVAILDSGVQKDHPDLKERIIEGRNFTDDGGPNDYDDFNGHGTHVAGTIAASKDNLEGGVVGVAPEAKLLILKVLDADGSGYYSWIINAIRYATNWTGSNGEKVQVISMSLGGPSNTDGLHEAIIDAVNHDIAVVCAAGNDGDGVEESFEFSYPASYNEVISVAASTIDGKLAPFSNNNENVDVIALGVDVLSTWPSSKYARISGTSMATPHVAGALALLIEQGEKEFNRKITEAEIYALLVKRTVELGFKRSSEGHGMVKLNYMDKLRSLIDYIQTEF